MTVNYIHTNNYNTHMYQVYWNDTNPFRFGSFVSLMVAICALSHQVMYTGSGIMHADIYGTMMVQTTYPT